MLHNYLSPTQMKSPYPQHLHDTHKIPPIAMRERGVLPRPFIYGELPDETQNTLTTDDRTMPIRIA